MATDRAEQMREAVLIALRDERERCIAAGTGEVFVLDDMIGVVERLAIGALPLPAEPEGTAPLRDALPG